MTADFGDPAPAHRREHVRHAHTCWWAGGHEPGFTDAAELVGDTRPTEAVRMRFLLNAGFRDRVVDGSYEVHEFLDNDRRGIPTTRASRHPRGRLTDPRCPREHQGYRGSRSDVSVRCCPLARDRRNQYIARPMTNEATSPAVSRNTRMSTVTPIIIVNRSITTGAGVIRHGSCGCLNERNTAKQITARSAVMKNQIGTGALPSSRWLRTTCWLATTFSLAAGTVVRGGQQVGLGEQPAGRPSPRALRGEATLAEAVRKRNLGCWSGMS